MNIVAGDVVWFRGYRDEWYRVREVDGAGYPLLEDADGRECVVLSPDMLVVDAGTRNAADLSLILSAVNAAMGASHTSAYEAVQALVAERERVHAAALKMRSLLICNDGIGWSHPAGRVDCHDEECVAARDLDAALKGGGK